MAEFSYIISAPEDDYDIPKESIGKIIFDRLKKRSPHEPINIDAVTKDVITCGKFLEESIKMTKVLKNLGVKKGDVISIVSETSINYFIPVVAAFYMGVAVSPFNPGYAVGELKRNILIAKPKLILSSESALDTVLKTMNELESSITVLLMGHISGKHPHINSYESILEVTSMNIESFKPQEFDYTEQVAFIIFSSGTTGLPKGVMLTHQNLRTTVGSLSHPLYGNTTMKDTTIIVVPFFHIYGPLLQLLALLTSMKSIIITKFQPDLYLKSIEEYKATKLFIVTPLLHFLARSPLVDNYDLSSVGHIFVGGAPLSKTLQTEAARRFPTVSIQQLYGLTETAGPTNIQLSNAKSGSVGLPVPGVIAKICDPDTNKNLGPLGVGEICFRGSMIMKGYMHIEDCFDEDGFFHTGDVGYYDHDGYFYIVDRIKELIKYKGFQVSPSELEALILTHPSVKDCGVIGIPDERAGELPFAFVVMEKDVSVSEQDIIDFVAERISIQKRLHGGVKFIDEIPKTAAGKIIRRNLLKIFDNLL